jgi:hypothetical protein
MSIEYSYSQYSSPSHHWKFKSPGRAARYWMYDGATLVYDGLHNESLGDYDEAQLDQLTDLIKAIFGAQKVTEARK